MPVDGPPLPGRAAGGNLIAMPTATKRRKNTVTKFVQDILDDTKELVDDVIDRARDAEDSVRDGIRDAVDCKDDDETPSETDVAGLQTAIAELSAKVDKLSKTSK